MIKRWIFLALAVLILLAPLPVKADELGVSAHAAVLLDAESGRVLYEKNGSDILPMASTTKIMTALLTAEYIDAIGDAQVQITKDMVAVEGSSMGLREGDEILLSDLLVGMLLPSGNDAAMAAALFISKTVNSFAALMNHKAELVGMSSTHFVTPSGLDDPEHYTTAHEMAVLTATAMKNKTFAPIFAAKRKTITYNGGKTQATFTNHNKLLSLYENCVGGKTGFTKKSGRCLVSAAEMQGVRLICVTLNAPDDWNDHISLYERGFSGVETRSFPECFVRIPETSGKHLIVRIHPYERGCFAEDKVEQKIYLPKFIYEGAYKKGEQLGKIVYLTSGVVGETVPILY